jgi:hypothetical protein
MYFTSERDNYFLDFYDINDINFNNNSDFIHRTVIFVRYVILFWCLFTYIYNLVMNVFDLTVYKDTGREI